MMNGPSLQETHAPEGNCFGCGVRNEEGLQIQSYAQGDKLIARWKGETRYEAFPGILNGGIIGSLLDCHSNWAAAHHLLVRDQLNQLPTTVTAEYTIKLLRGTPSEKELQLEAWVTESKGSKVYIEANLLDGEDICATCTGLFIAVKPGHPAYGRW